MEMSYPGGIAAKHGDRYEARWTIRCLLDLLRGNAESIELEPVGWEGEGVEFVVVRGEQREYHQVKRRGRGRWTLAALSDEGVLSTFSAKLRTGGSTRFVSEQDANELRILTERARLADDLSDFLGRHVAADKWADAFRVVASRFDMSEQEAFDALRRIHVTVIDENELVTINEAWVEPLIAGVPADNLAILADIVRDTVPGRLNASKVWTLLREKYNKTSSQWRQDQDLRERVGELTATYLNPLCGVRLKAPVERIQAVEVRASLEDDTLDGVLLTGTAGSGKSDLLWQTISALSSDSWNVLCLRADQLEPSRTVVELGAQLGLPGSPVGVLAAISSPATPSLLVIDQLDAVSLASGRVTGLWDSLYALICRAKSMPGMKVLIACRQFDVDNDHRMRALTSNEHKLNVVSLPPLDSAQINQAVSGMGLDPMKLDDKRRALLAVPLHLTLLEAIAQESDALSFDSITDLFARYWRRKQRDTDIHAGRRVQWATVIDAATGYMSDRLRLSVPTVELDNKGLLDDVEALASEHVLVKDGSAYRFFHEGFFDYAFARTYLRTGRTICDLLVSGEQDLFRRAQVRQLLAQERDSNNQAYIASLTEIMTRPDIRFHIKQLTVAWLVSIHEPTREEVIALAGVLADPEISGSQNVLIWRVFGQLPWFDAALSQGLMDRWLSDANSAIVDVVVQLLGTVVNERPEQVINLILSHDDGSERWTERIAYIVRFSDVHTRRDLFDMLLDVVKREAFVGAGDHDAWLYGHELPSEQPAWAAELMNLLLQRANERARGQGERHALTGGASIQHEHSAMEYVTKLADASPDTFLAVVLPFMTNIIDSDLDESTEDYDDRLPADRVWSYRLSLEAYTFADTLLVSARAALGRLAAEQHTAFMKWACELRGRRDDTSQYLLYYGLLGNPSEFADFTAEVLVEGNWRFRADEEGEGFWITNRLLSAIAPRLTSTRIQRLEQAIIGFTTWYERTPGGIQGRGRAELWLLAGLSTGAISEKASKRLGELERKFPQNQPEKPQGIIAGFVRSPIDIESARRMSDEDWLRAINKHRERWEDKRSADLIGGADQLATVLQEMTQREPDRFAQLGLRFPRDTVETYVEHLVLGLCRPDSEVVPAAFGSVVALCRYIDEWPSRPATRWTPRLLAKYASEDMPDDLCALVVRIATDDPDPQQDVWKIEATGGRAYYGGDIHGAGMNSARGAAAEAIAELVVAAEGRADFLAPAVAALCSDPITAVRSCAAFAVHGLMRWRRDKAVENLLVLVQDNEDRLLATNPVQRVMIDAMATHWDRVRPVVERMLASEDDEARDAGGALASIAGLDESDAGDLLAQALADGDARIRKGVAKVLAARAIASRYRDRCTAGLRRLFEDEDAEVRQEAAKVFWRVRDRQLAELDDVAHAFLASQAFDVNYHHFLHALKVSTADVVDLVLATADRMVSSYGRRLGDLRESIGGDSRYLSDLVLQVLGTLDADRAKINQALDVLDVMLEAGVWGVTEAIETVER
jgi:hypothetical protein